MKTTVDIYSCDFCGSVIDDFENDYTGRMNGAWIDKSGTYQTITVVENRRELLFCKTCCAVLKKAIGSGLVSIENEIEHKMIYDAGYRKDGNKWISVNLYSLKLKRGLIND